MITAYSLPGANPGRTLCGRGSKWQHCAVVVGNPGAGKTQWALSHFNDGKGALFVCQMDDLQAYKPEKFGRIVFDDMLSKHLLVSTQKHLLDWKDPRTINCRYFNAEIPAKTKKIFTCNWDAFPFKDDDAAIAYRIFNVELDNGTKSRRDKLPQCTPLSKAKPARNNILAMLQPRGAQPGDGEGDVAEELFDHLDEDSFGHMQPAPMPAPQESADTGGAESSRRQVGKGEQAMKRARS